jgi:hypothetical protein
MFIQVFAKYWVNIYELTRYFQIKFRPERIATVVLCKTQNGKYNGLIATSKNRAVFDIIDKHNMKVNQDLFKTYEVFTNDIDELKNMIFSVYQFNKMPEIPIINNSWDEIVTDSSYQINFCNKFIVINFQDDNGRKSLIINNSFEDLKKSMEELTFNHNSNRTVGFTVKTSKEEK